MAINNSSVAGRPPPLILEEPVDEELFNIYRLYYFIIDAVICLPTIVGNVLVIIAVARLPVLRRNTSCLLICNLAVSDLLVGAVVCPVHMLLLQHDGVKGSPAFCLLHHSLVYTLVAASVINLLLLSLERLHAILRPFTHAVVFTKRRMLVAIAFIWLTMFAYGFLPVFGWHRYVDPLSFKCLYTAVLSEVYARIICLCISVAMIVNGVFFVILAYVAMKAVTSFPDGTTGEQRAQTRKDVRHTRMMLAVSGLFIVFWAPFCALTLVPSPSPYLRLAIAWCGSLGLVNSSVNWIVYGIMSEKFRIAFKAVLSCNYDGVNSEISNLMT